MSDEPKPTIPDLVRRSLSRLVMACPECRGYGNKGGLLFATDRQPCPICKPVRQWIWEIYGIDFEELT